jgi:hypothetical protein
MGTPVAGSEKTAKAADGPKKEKVAGADDKPAKGKGKRAAKASAPAAEDESDEEYFCSLCGLEENHPVLGELDGPYEQDRDGNDIWCGHKFWVRKTIVLRVARSCGMVLGLIDSRKLLTVGFVLRWGSSLRNGLCDLWSDSIWPVSLCFLRGRGERERERGPFGNEPWDSLVRFHLVRRVMQGARELRTVVARVLHREQRAPEPRQDRQPRQEHGT